MLFGNNALFLRNPVRAIGGLNQATERANWGAWGATRNFYAGQATVISGSSIANTAGNPVGYKPPVSYSWPIKTGVDQRRIHSNLTATATLSGSMLAARLMSSALTGAGDLPASSMGLIVSLVTALSGSGDLSGSELDLIYQMASDLGGEGDLAAVVSAIGHLSSALSGTGTAAASFISGPTGTPGYLNSDIDSVGDLLTTANVAPAVWDALCEAGITNKGALRIILSSAALKLGGLPGTTLSFRDKADTKNRIVAVVDANGNRTSITLDPED